MCEICKHIGECHPRCPKYVASKSHLICDICREPIIQNEEYVENNDLAAAHVDCFISIRDLLPWLGHDVKIKEEEENDYD